MAQLVKHLTSTQIMISQFMRSSPTSGSMLTVWSLPGILPLSPFLSVSPSVSLSLSPLPTPRWGACSLSQYKLKKNLKENIFFSIFSPAINIFASLMCMKWHFMATFMYIPLTNNDLHHIFYIN